MLVILACVILLILFRFPLRAVSGDARVPVVQVRRADFLRTLRLAGTTEAVFSHSIVAPRLAGANLGAMVITRLIPTGARVKKGDLLVEFDREQQYKDFLDKQASYRDLSGQLAVKRAAEDATRATDDAALRQAEDAVEAAKLEVKKDELVTRIQAEINQETLQEDQATLKQLRHTYALKRQAAAAGIRDLQIQQERARQTMLNAQQNAQKMLIRSPMDGVAVLTEVALSNGMGLAQEGSQVWPGLSFMRVIDPSRMDVRVRVNQADLPYLHVGQRAVVHLDAYPGLSFPAALEELSPLGQPGDFSSEVMTFTGVFPMQGTNPKLMPDLSAAVDVQLQSEDNVLVVPIQSVAFDNGNPYVWLKTGSGFEKRSVSTGPENDLDVVIDSGLALGDTVREYAEGSEGGSSQP